PGAARLPPARIGARAPQPAAAIAIAERGRGAARPPRRARARGRRWRAPATPAETTTPRREYRGTGAPIKQPGGATARPSPGLERTPVRGEPCLQPRRTVAVAASPGLIAVQIATTRARVRVLHLYQFEILFPVLTLFRQRRRTVADFDPLHATVVELTRRRHVSQVFIAGDRPVAERSVVDRARPR